MREIIKPYFYEIGDEVIFTDLIEGSKVRGIYTVESFDVDSEVYTLNNGVKEIRARWNEIDELYKNHFETEGFIKQAIIEREEREEDPEQEALDDMMMEISNENDFISKMDIEPNKSFNLKNDVLLYISRIINHSGNECDIYRLKPNDTVFINIDFSPFKMGSKNIGLMIPRHKDICVEDIMYQNKIILNESWIPVNRSIKISNRGNKNIDLSLKDEIFQIVFIEKALDY